MIHAHQPGSLPIDVPESIPNPAIEPERRPVPAEPTPWEPVRVPEKVPEKVSADYNPAFAASDASFFCRRT